MIQQASKLFFLAIFCFANTFCSETVRAETTLADKVWKDRIGERAPLSVTTPATGIWAAEYPFDPKKFGTIRGFSPATGAKKSIVMVYVRSLNANTIDLLRAIDDLISTREELNWSYVQVFDEKGAQVGGYTADEILARITELKKISDEQNLKSLSLGLAANGSPKSAAQVGLDKDADIVVAFIRKPDGPKKSPVVAWYRALHSETLNATAITEFSKTLDGLIQTP
jgi:hypothetical protein